VHKYYKRLLGRQHATRQQLDPNVIDLGNTLTMEQQLKICAPFTEQEIKSIMSSIPKPNPLDLMASVVVSLKPLGTL